MNRSLLLSSFALAAAASSGAALALEPLKTYDNFGTTPIDGSRWLLGEQSVQIKGGQLVVSERVYGLTTSNAGELDQPLRTYFSNPSAITEMKAKVTVNGLEVNACPANPIVSLSRARISGSFFNIGTPTSGSEAGDVIAQMRVVRASNSTDPAGMLRVQGTLFNCVDESCNTTAGTQVTDLGPVNIGQSVIVELQWDKANKQFIYTRDNGAATATLAYTASDGQPPGVAFKDLEVRVGVDSCVGSAPLTGFVNASFDNVQVNKSAAP